MGLTTLPPSCAECLEIWEPQPTGTLRACPGLYWDCFTFLCEIYVVFGRSFITLDIKACHSRQIFRYI